MFEDSQPAVLSKTAGSPAFMAPETLRGLCAMPFVFEIVLAIGSMRSQQNQVIPCCMTQR